MKAYRNQFLVLVLLWLLSPVSVLAAVCDTDDDGDIDRNDIIDIALARNTPAAGPDDPRDADGDGVITILDARVCTLQCTLSRCTIIDPPVDVPTIDVSPDPLDFGEVLVGNSASLALVVSNTGTATLSVSNITSSGAPFSVTSPTAFDITVGGAAQNVQINFSPVAAGDLNGTITINSNADNIDPVVIAVTGRGVEPQVNVPTIDVNPDPLDFGEVFVGSTANLPLVVENTGAATLSVSNIGSSGAPFAVFPPVSFDIADGGSPRNVDISFSPATEGDFNGTVTIDSNADNIDPVVIAVTGRGVEPAPALVPDIDTADRIDFGAISEGATAERQLTVRNLGDAPLNVSSVSSDSAAFQVSALPGQAIPFALSPGGSQNVVVTFVPPAGTAGSTLAGILSIDSNDPDESPTEVELEGDVLQTVTVLVNNPILRANVSGPITGLPGGNCGNVSGEVLFGVSSSGAQNFNVTLTDQGGAAASSPSFTSVEAGGVVAFSGIDACGLDDGVLALSVNLGSLAPFVGTPAIKNTSVFPAPVLDPVAAASVAQVIEICGSSRASTTVKIEGGANTVSVQLDNATTAFCLNVPLRPNTENTLIATATDNIAPAPKPRASASPIQVTHIDPSSIIIAEASSRPLTIEETELLVQNGVIDLDDPTNFNVSMFTIVLTIGQFPVTISQPVAVPSSPGVSYGSGGGGGWTGGGGSVVSTPRPVTGCVTGCSNIVIIKTPSGQTIPGVIIIDGRIKTLKEFFQVTIAIQNTSTDFVLADMAANIVLPAGLSPVRAGPGTDVSTINTGSAIDSVDIGDIGPQQTGTGQFVIRGDGIGTHNVDVDFDGFLTGGGLAQPEPVSGSAGTSVQVFGPPTLDVVVRHPSRVGQPDVTFNEIYDLIVEITNTSPRPALYTSLELFVGGDVELVDGNGDPIPGSSEIISFGHIPAGRAVSAAFRVRSFVEGEIIACQAIASENISLTVDTGPDGTDCNIANTYPANFEALPADQPPVVIGINPLNGQPNIPVTTSVLATLTPESASCIVGDTFTNVVEVNFIPGDPGAIQVISADLVQAGTFYLEELDTFGNPVKHIPTDLTVVSPPAGGTTIAVLRLGLDAPHTNSQYFLKDNTTYRATLVGGPGGICSDASGAEMVEDFTWTFSTEQTCSGISAPIASMSAPPNGSIERPLNQSIVLNFTNRMNPASFGFIPGNLGASSFSVYAGAIETGGEIDIGTATAVPGTGVFSNLNRTLTYAPLANFAEDTDVFIRLTDGLRDICGNPLQTPPIGVQLLNFQTIPPDTTAPAAPVVNPVPAFTNLPAVQVSGQAEAGSTVTITGGSVVVNTTASGAGNFNVSVPLNLNAINDFSVQATDASNNSSTPATTTDNNGILLRTEHDNVRPLVSSVTPLNGAADVARNIVIQADFDEQIKPTTINNLNFTLEGSVIPGTLAAVGDTGFSFTPDNLLDFNKTYNIRIRANGMRDLAGNGLSSEFVASFTTQNFPLPVVNSVAPDNGVQGTTFVVTFTGTDLATASAVNSANPGISGTVDSASDTTVMATITIDALAATGATTLGLTTLGGSASLPFTVLHKAPIVTGIAPNSGDQGATVAAQIQGSGLTDISSISIDGSGVTVNDLGTGSDALRNVQFVIDPAATPGARSVTVTTPGGSDSGVFTVIEFFPAPLLNSLTPDSAVQGSNLQVTFDGSNLSSASAVVSSNPGVTGTIFSATDTTVVVDLVVAAGATLGSSQLGLTTSGGSSTLLFTVTPLILPPVVSGIVPDNGVQGSTLNAAINGSGFSTLTGLSTNCAGLTATDLGTGNDARIDVEIVVGPAVTPGPCLVTVATLGGIANGVFNVIEAPDTITLTPSPGQLLTRSSLSMTVTLNAAAPTGGQVIDLATDNAIVSAPATVTVPGGSLSAGFAVTSVNDLGTTQITASASGFTGDVSSVAVIARDLSISSPLVGIDRTVTATINLPQPAPAGGAVFDMSVDDTSIVTISPAQVTIPQGQSSASFELTGQFIIGTATVTADGTGNGYESRDLLISVTDRLIDLPTAQDLFLGETISLPLLIAPDAAGAGGVQIVVQSSNPAVVQVLTPVVIVPEGTFQTSIQIRAASSATGLVVITASNAGFAPDTTLVNVTAALDILQSFSTFEETETDQIFFNLLSGGGPFPAPAGGVEVTLASSDSSCVSVTSPVSIAEGSTFGSAIVSYGGTAGSPCSATVTADAGVFGTDTIDVTIDQVADIGTLTVQDNWNGDLRLGSDTQTRYIVRLSNAAHGGVTVQVKSSNPDIAVVTADVSTAGSPVIELPVADGQTTATFYVQGLSGATGTINITAQNEQFTTASTAVEVVPGVLVITGLTGATTSLSTDDPFYVRTGYLHSNGVTFRNAPASAVGGPLVVTLNSSDIAVGEVKTSTASGASVTVEVPVNANNSPTSVAAGGSAFDPTGGGTVSVFATAPGFDGSYSGASAAVVVSQPALTVSDDFYGDNRIGINLQKQYRVTLGGSDHGGVTVNVQSDNAALLLSPDATTAGSSSIDLVIADGQSTSQTFYIHGVSEATGVTLTATQALFTTATNSIDVVPSVLQILSLGTAINTLSPDDAFNVRTGYLHPNGVSFREVPPSATSGAITVSLSSDNTAVGRLITAAATGSPVTVEVPVNSARSPTSVAAGGVALEPLAQGTVNVSATATGFDGVYSGSNVAVTVSQPALTVSDDFYGDNRIGINLQKQYRVTLGGSDHGGVTVNVQSDNAALLLSPDATTAGSSSIDLVIADGQSTSQTFYIHGVSEATGVTLTATQALFTTATNSIDVVPSVLQILSLGTAINTLSPDDAFNVRTGYLHPNGVSFREVPPSATSGAITVSLSSDNTAVGRLITTAATGSPVTVEVPVNSARSPTSVVAGGVALEPLAQGTVNVSATATGFDGVYSGSNVAVTVSQPALTVSDDFYGDNRIGINLQKQYRVTLGGSDHGGVTVNVQSDNAALLLSPDATTAGSSSIDLVIADGQSTSQTFYIHGVSEATGVTLTATQALFTTATNSIDVVPSVLQILSLGTAINTLSPDDAFNVRTGYLHPNGVSFREVPPSATSGAITVSLSSDNTAVGRLITAAATGSPVTVEVPVNSARSPTSVAAGGVALEPLAQGTVNVSATATGFDGVYSGSNVAVVVSQPALTVADVFIGDNRIGGGLQRAFRVSLNGSDHGGVTIRVASSDTFRLLVAPDGTTAGAAFIDLFIPDGVTFKDFFVQGINGVTGNVTLTASNLLFDDGTLGIDVVPGVTDILTNLATSIAAGAADDPFTIRTGYMASNGTTFRAAVVSASAAPLQVLVSSSNVAAGQLKTLVETGESATVEINANQFDSASSVATGGVAFDPVAAGITNVSTSVIGFDNTRPQSTVTITVTP